MISHMDYFTAPVYHSVNNTASMLTLNLYEQVYHQS